MWKNLTYKTWVTPHKWHIMKAGNGRYFVLFPHLLNDNFNYFDFHTSQVQSTHPFYHMLVHFMKKSKGETQIECQKWWLVASDQSSSRTAASWGFTCEERLEHVLHIAGPLTLPLQNHSKPYANAMVPLVPLNGGFPFFVSIMVYESLWP